MITVAICEDDKSYADGMLEKIKISGVFGSFGYRFFSDGSMLKEAYASGERFDIVFLDVDMPQLDGISAGKYVNSVSPGAVIVFVTNYPQYAIDAYDCCAFHYLLKNVDEKRFVEVLKRVRQRYDAANKRYTVETKKGFISLPIADIYYIESFYKNLYINTETELYIVKGSIKRAMGELEEYGSCRIHQGYIVNFAKAREIQGNDIILDNGKKVMISVRKKSEVLKAYADYIERRG